MTQANAVRSSRKHRSFSSPEERKADTRPYCTMRQRSEGMHQAPYYHATLGRDSSNVSPSGPTLLLERQRTRPPSTKRREKPSASDGSQSCRPASHARQACKPTGGEGEMPLRQTCSEEYLRAQYAFKVLMIH